LIGRARISFLVEGTPAPEDLLMHRRAFTLVELLVVCALLAILAAILFPAFAAARDKARQTTCLSNVRQISLAQSLYIADWDEHLPHWWEYGTPRPEPYGPFTFWTEYFQPYLKSSGVLRCPSFTWGPEGPDAGEKLADYSLLTWGGGGTGTAGDPAWRWAGPPMTLAQVARPSETFNISEGYTTTAVTRGLVARHANGLVLGFLDGHARWLPRDEAFRVERQPSGRWIYRHIMAEGG
jgi:prepilin-type N-terminal cleavage/methylation domain-containing protein/prepilin-type processing-associated H-X9-DG protein